MSHVTVHVRTVSVARVTNADAGTTTSMVALNPADFCGILINIYFAQELGLFEF